MDTTTATEEAYQLIDQALRDLKGLNLTEAPKMMDLLLDIRSLIGKIEQLEENKP